MVTVLAVVFTVAVMPAGAVAEELVPLHVTLAEVAEPL